MNEVVVFWLCFHRGFWPWIDADAKTHGLLNDVVVQVEREAVRGPLVSLHVDQKPFRQKIRAWFLSPRITGIGIPSGIRLWLSRRSGTTIPERPALPSNE